MNEIVCFKSLNFEIKVCERFILSQSLLTVSTINHNLQKNKKRLSKILPAGIALMGICLTLLLAACDEKLPEPTTKGANTFACKVNGESWIPDAGGSFMGKKLVLTHTYLFKPKRMFVLYATRRTKKENTTISLALKDVRSAGTQYFAFDTNPYPGELHYKNHAVYIEYEPGTADYVTNSRYTGSINFTRVDTINHIISGTFEFTAENTDGSGETIKVTDGRFDINSATINK